MMTQGQETSRWRRDPVRHARADNKAACDSTSVLVNLNILEHFLLLASSSLDYRMIYSALLFCASQQKWRITSKWEAGSCKNSFLFFSKLVAGRLVTILYTIWLQVNLSQISVAQKPPSIWRSERIWASVGQESIPWIMAPFYQPPFFDRHRPENVFHVWVREGGIWSSRLLFMPHVCRWEPCEDFRFGYNWIKLRSWP